MKKFNVCVTRDITEQFNCEVEANSESEAEEIASDLSKSADATWETTDWVGDSHFAVSLVAPTDSERG